MRFRLKIKDSAGTYWTNIFPSTADSEAVMIDYEKIGCTVLEMEYV